MSKYVNNMIIEEAYVSYELAKLLNEKGFDVSCLSTYDINNGKQYFHTSYIMCATRINAPTHQMAMAWVRENGWHIDVSLSYNDNDDACYYVVIQNTKTFISADTDLDDKEFKTYEEAVEAALKYSLENLI